MGAPKPPRAKRSGMALGAQAVESNELLARRNAEHHFQEGGSGEVGGRGGWEVERVSTPKKRMLEDLLLLGQEMCCNLHGWSFF